MSRLFLGAALTMALMGTHAMAADTATDAKASCCLTEGDSIAAFHVTKVAGAADDGIEVGEELCYRCRYGASPMVMVFARTTDGQVTKLVSELDAAVKANSSEKLRGLVTLIGEDADKLTGEGEKIAKSANADNVPVVIYKDPQGPAAYKIGEDAEVTVVVAKESQVVATHSFKADAIDVAAVMNEVKAMLN